MMAHEALGPTGNPSVIVVKNVYPVNVYISIYALWLLKQLSNAHILAPVVSGLSLSAHPQDIWRFSTAWYGTARHGSVRYGTAQFGSVCISTAV